MRRLLLLTAQAVLHPRIKLRVSRKLLFLFMLIFPAASLWAQQPVSGIVKAGDTPLADTTVIVDGTKTSVLTNATGLATKSLAFTRHREAKQTLYAPVI